MDEAVQSGAGATETRSGVPIRPWFGPGDLDERSFDANRDLGPPGSPPFTRGIHPTMYRGRLWTIRQVTGFETPVETNARLRFLVERGQTGINVVFDQPTHFHLDSDHPLARGEVGKVGVPWDTLQDLRDLFDGIDLADVSVSLIANSGWAFLPFYLALARERGTPFDQLRGTLQDDPLLVFHSCGTYTVPLEASIHLLTDVAEYCVAHVPRWNFVSVAGYNTRESGASAVQEAAISLASGLCYGQAFRARGLDPEAFLPRISFFLEAGTDIFEEIAKFRAMRRIWAQLTRDLLGAREERSMWMRFHTQTAGSSLTREQPLNNVVRTTIQALAAVLGGTQSLHTNSYDEAIGLPTEEAVTVAIRTQQILQYESGVPNVIDPLGGSYFVESLTKDLEDRVRQLLDEIEDHGGMVEACNSGWIQDVKHAEAERTLTKVETGERVVVGVNAFREEGEVGIPLFRVDPAREVEQVRRLERWRAQRDGGRTRQALERLGEEAAARHNVIESAVEAVLAGATIGELGAAFKSVFGDESLQREAARL